MFLKISVMESSNFFKMNEQCLLLSVKITAWLVVVKEGSEYASFRYLVYVLQSLRRHSFGSDFLCQIWKLLGISHSSVEHQLTTKF